MGRYISAEQSP